MSGMNTDAEQAMDLYISGSPATDEQVRHARLSVCDHSEDAADARGLMETLGLLAPAVPSITHAKRKQLLADRRAARKKAAEAALVAEMEAEGEGELTRDPDLNPGRDVST